MTINQKFDILEVSQNGAYYDIEAWSNPAGVGTTIINGQLISTVDPNNTYGCPLLRFTLPLDITDDERVKYSFSSLSFSSFDKTDYLMIDIAKEGEQPLRRGKVAIKDTDYPPPPAQLGFDLSRAFDLRKIKFTRTGITQYNIEVTLTVIDGFLYLKKTPNIKIHHSQSALVIYTNRDSGGVSGDITFAAVGLNTNGTVSEVLGILALDCNPVGTFQAPLNSKKKGMIWVD